MLPEYRQFYQSLDHRLQYLQAMEGDSSTLQTSVQEIQNFFQQKILPVNLEPLGAIQAAKIQSFQVEIKKQLRLLGADLMFLQAARQAATQQQRQRQINDRIDLLRQYCAAVLAAED